MNGDETAIFADAILYKLKLLIGIIAATWFLWLFNTLFLRKSLNRYGIRPRQVGGLWGIGFAPFLHGNVKHLIGNTTTFFILGGLLLLKGTDAFLIVTAIAALSSGLGIWLFGGSNTNHIGASGVIFGYLGFLILRGYFTREIGSALLSVVVFCLYGGMLWRVFPFTSKFSWEGHLFGFVGGGLTARYLETIAASLSGSLLSDG